jgi:beta-lactamase class A
MAPASRWQALEAAAAGRLGVAVLDTADGRLQGHRLDERFPLCSTFKWLAAALVLHRVDAGQEQLDRRIRFGPEAMVPYAPVTSKHMGGEGMTLAELCEAAITLSDNPAGNLLLQSFGGPEALTRHARTLGDTMTRLDRWEPELNEATPGDPRDTTTPRAMATALRATMLGEALSAPSREQLVRWMQATQTNGKRLRADLPTGWRMGSKTGTGARGTTNDVGVFWPPGRAPVVVAVYLTETSADEATRNAAIARVAHGVTGGG